jgi:hypothetical protein
LVPCSSTGIPTSGGAMDMTFAFHLAHASVIADHQRG